MRIMLITFMTCLFWGCEPDLTEDITGVYIGKTTSDLWTEPDPLFELDLTGADFRINITKITSMEVAFELNACYKDYPIIAKELSFDLVGTVKSNGDISVNDEIFIIDDSGVRTRYSFNGLMSNFTSGMQNLILDYTLEVQEIMPNSSITNITYSVKTQVTFGSKGSSSYNC